MPTVLATTAWPCPTCRDGSGWVRFRVQGQWQWAACADCNDMASKGKPPLCPVCQVTRPFCDCHARRPAS